MLLLSRLWRTGAAGRALAAPRLAAARHLDLLCLNWLAPWDCAAQRFDALQRVGHRRRQLLSSLVPPPSATSSANLASFSASSRRSLLAAFFDLSLKRPCPPLLASNGQGTLWSLSPEPATSALSASCGPPPGNLWDS